MAVYYIYCPPCCSGPMDECCCGDISESATLDVTILGETYTLTYIPLCYFEWTDGINSIGASIDGTEEACYITVTLNLFETDPPIYGASQSALIDECSDINSVVLMFGEYEATLILHNP